MGLAVKPTDGLIVEERGHKMDCKELEKIQEEFQSINDKYRKVSHIDEHIEMMGQVEKLLLALKEFDIAS